MRLSVYPEGHVLPILEPNSVVTPDAAAARGNRVPLMRRRLLSPVNAGVSAARHLLWYLSYHAGGPRTPGR
jgi:hypothetical protein